jgi:hypothetical protein
LYISLNFRITIIDIQGYLFAGTFPIAGSLCIIKMNVNGTAAWGSGIDLGSDADFWSFAETTDSYYAIGDCAYPILPFLCPR